MMADPGQRPHATLSVATILAESARRHRDRSAVIAGEETITYGDLWEQTRRVAGALASLGVSRGDRVAMMLPNVADFPRVYYAILALGAIVVPVHPLLRREEIAQALQASGSRLLVSSGDPEAAAAAESLRLPLLPAGDPDAQLARLAASAEPIRGVAAVSPLDPAVMLFTSGTSGRPKGALLSHLNLVEQTHVALIDSFDVRTDDVMVAALPLSHVFGQSNVLNTAFRRGATVLLVPRFSPEETLASMVQHGATVFAGVPTMLIGLLGTAQRTAARPPLRYVISGGASLPLAVLEAFRATLQAEVYEGYGLSETSPTATVNHVDAPIGPGTVGTPIWGVEVGIVDPDRSDVAFLPEGEIGEVVISGHSLFLGYHGDPDATKAAVVDGWLRTGDLGHLDESGRLTIVDRTKDLILRGGYNVYPREVEEVLSRLAGIRSVAVFGVPDDRLGQEVAAAVVVEPGSPLDAGQIIDYARTHVAAHKYPRRVFIVETLPLGPSGKVLKRELAALFAKRA